MPGNSIDTHFEPTFHEFVASCDVARNVCSALLRGPSRLSCTRNAGGGHSRDRRLALQFTRTRTRSVGGTARPARRATAPQPAADPRAKRQRAAAAPHRPPQGAPYWHQLHWHSGRAWQILLITS